MNTVGANKNIEKLSINICWWFTNLKSRIFASFPPVSCLVRMIYFKGCFPFCFSWREKLRKILPLFTTPTEVFAAIDFANVIKQIAVKFLNEKLSACITFHLWLTSLQPFGCITPASFFSCLEEVLTHRLFHFRLNVLNYCTTMLLLILHRREVPFSLSGVGEEISLMESVVRIKFFSIT